MRALTLSFLFLLAGCAPPASQPASPAPMAAGCPMMRAGSTHAMPGMAMAAPSDSGATHKCPCPMHAEGHAMASGTGTPAHTGTDSTHTMPGCPMCASGRCPMHAAAPPAAGAARD
jgi:hypothetical protein